MEAYLFCPACQVDNSADRLHCRLCGTSLDGVPLSAEFTATGREVAELRCLRCSVPLRFEGFQRLQRSNLELRDGLFASEVRTEMYVCPRCGHLELFHPDVGQEFRP